MVGQHIDDLMPRLVDNPKDVLEAYYRTRRTGSPTRHYYTINKIPGEAQFYQNRHRIYHVGWTYPGKPAPEAIAVLRGEIESFGHGLADKPYVIAANKADMDPDGVELHTLKESLNADDAARVMPISALQRTGLERLLEDLYSRLHPAE